jgi:hypothetical protein
MVLLAIVSCIAPAIAGEDDQGTGSGAPSGEDDPTRPPTALDLRFRFGDDITKKQDEKQRVTFRSNVRIELSKKWLMGLRFDPPLVASNAVTMGNLGGDYGYGVGRPLVSAFLANILNDRWAYAFGSQIVAPAASGKQFGSGNWDVRPFLAVRAMLPEISDGSYFVPLVRFAQTFAQADSGRPQAICNSRPN